MTVTTTARDALPPLPEPPGPRCVALELVRLGLARMRGDWPQLATGATDPAISRALREHRKDGAIVWDGGRGAYVLTERGRALLGPDLRQRGG